MRIFKRVYDYTEQQRVIDNYIVDDCEENLQNLLNYMKEGSICIDQIPKSKQTKDLVLRYLEIPEVTHVRVKWISKKLFDDELWRKISAKCTDFEDIPQKYLTKRHFKEIACSEYYSCYYLHLIPLKNMTEKLLLEALVISFACLRNSKLDNEIFEKFDIEKLKKKALQIRKKRAHEKKEKDLLEMRQNGWIVYKKGYDVERDLFFFRGAPTKHGEAKDYNFDSFDRFYKFMLSVLPEERQKSSNPKPLESVDLMEYDFRDIDLTKYDLAGCFIKANVLEKNNCFIDYSSRLLSLDYEDDLCEDSSTAPVVYENKDITIGDTSEDICISEDYNYISDIHLTHRIRNQLGTRFTKEQVIYLVNKTVDEIDDYGTTLIAGDTCDSFSLNEVFYRRMDNYAGGSNIIILGNHELWDETLYKESPVEDVINAYRVLFGGMRRSCFLQNELLIDNKSGRYILSESEILEIPNKKLVQICKNAESIILGGIGFTGYCKDKDPKTGKVYNAEFGLYRKALGTIGEDLQQTKRFESIYNKIRKVLSHERVIVLTHTPKECWSKKPYVPNWAYVNGHTHRNSRIINNEKMVFADNQIGYHNEKVGLKSFGIVRKNDVFYEKLEDGIHEITVQQYREFNDCNNIYAHVSAGIGRIFMLKKKKLFMFLLKRYVKSEKKEKLYLLDGGSIHSASFDEQYYYENMDTYARAIKAVFGKYWQEEKRISRMIERIGGSGKVHGCIIDIDYYNHAYLNPFDGKLTFYYATSMSQKLVYTSINELLLAQAKYVLDEEKEKYLEMEKKYTKLVSKNSNRELVTSTEPVFVGDTDMYRVSRVIKRFQFISEKNIIRSWNDGFLLAYKNNKKQIMDFSKLFPIAEVDEKYEID